MASHVVKKALRKWNAKPEPPSLFQPCLSHGDTTFTPPRERHALSSVSIGHMYRAAVLQEADQRQEEKLMMLSIAGSGFAAVAACSALLYLLF